MADENAPVRKAHRHAHAHLSTLAAHREAAQALAANHLAATPIGAVTGIEPPPEEPTP